MPITRRTFGASLSAAALASAAPSRFTVGITTNTRGGWEKDVFLSFREAREAGYRWVESFISYFPEYLDHPQALKEKVDEIGVRFVTISNNAPVTEMQFEDASKRGRLIEDHMRLVRLLKYLGCDHLKINSGTRRTAGTTDEDLKVMAVTYNELGKRISGEGLKLGVHAHMWSQFENRHEVDRIMDATDPKHVWFVLDTGHMTMAGMDPLELTKKLGHRIIEFHLKDVEARHKGGAQKRVDRNDPMKNPIFFELGSKHGVDFPGIKAHLDRIGWQGWLTVELDSSPFRPPKESAVISRQYLERVLHLSW